MYATIERVQSAELYLSPEDGCLSHTHTHPCALFSSKFLPLSPPAHSWQHTHTHTRALTHSQTHEPFFRIVSRICWTIKYKFDYQRKHQITHDIPVIQFHVYSPCSPPLDVDIVFHLPTCKTVSVHGLFVVYFEIHTPCVRQICAHTQPPHSPGWRTHSPLTIRSFSECDGRWQRVHQSTKW